MRGQLFSLVVGVVALAAAALGRPSPPDPADTFAFNAKPMITLNHPDSPDSWLADLARRSPVCDCDPGKKCPCADCLCNTVPEAPLQVGQPPDLVSITNGEIKSAQPNVTKSVTSLHEPPPGLIVPVATVKKNLTVQPATGHWETRSAGIRGRRSYQVWVSHPANSAGECTSAACSTGYGAAPMRFGGACRSCR